MRPARARLRRSPGRGRRGRRTEARLPVLATYRRVAQVYARRYRFLLAIGLLIGVPIGLVDALAVRVEAVDIDTAAKALGVTAGALAGFLLSLFAGQLYEGLVGAAAAEVRRGHEPSAPGRLVRGLPYRRMMVANLLYVVGTVLGVLLLAIPGLIFFHLVRTRDGAAHARA